MKSLSGTFSLFMDCVVMGFVLENAGKTSKCDLYIFNRQTLFTFFAQWKELGWNK